MEKKEGEIDSAAGKEEKEAGDGNERKEKETDCMSKEKDKTSEMDKDTPAEGSEGKTNSEDDKSKG